MDDAAHPVEEEWQLLAPAGVEPVLPTELAGLMRRSLAVAVHHDNYLDTAAGQLATAGIAFRLRRPADGSDGTWTLKLADQTPHGPARSRVELEWPERQLGSCRPPLTPGQVATEIAAWQELGRIGVRPVEIADIGTIEVERRKAVYAWPEDPHDEVVEVAWDRVRYPDGHVELRAEVEALRAGAPVAAVATALNDLVDGLLTPTSVSKGDALRQHLAGRKR